MKKSLVAGAASLAFATMPVIGVFATNPSSVVDTLQVTIAESCDFQRTTGSANETKGLTAGQLDTDFATHVFTATCNNGLGYDINAVFTSLTHTGNSGAPIAYSATTPTAGSGTWTAALSGGNIAETGGKLGSLGTQDPAGGTTYSVTYKVSLANDQAQGTYQGTATYTLVQKTSS